MTRDQLIPGTRYRFNKHYWPEIWVATPERELVVAEIPPNEHIFFDVGTYLNAEILRSFPDIWDSIELACEPDRDEQGRIILPEP